MSKKNVITIISLIVLLSISLIVTKALYKGSDEGQANLSVASVKTRLINQTTHVEVLDLQKYTNEFSVVNYDENNQISEVGLKYTLSFELTDEDAPIDMKLYKINSNGTETEVSLNRNLETGSYSFEAGKSGEDKYKLEMWFNLATGKMDENVDLKVNVKSVQVEPLI